MKVSNVGRILSPLRKEKMLVFGSIIAGILAAVLNLSCPILIGAIIGELADGKPDDTRFIWLVSFFVCSWVLTWAVSIIANYVGTKTNQNILKSLRMQVLHHFLRLAPVESERISAGRVEAYITSDLPVWARLYGPLLAESVHSLAQFIGAMIALSHLDSRLTLWIAPFLLLGFFIPFTTSQYFVTLNRHVQYALSHVLEKSTDTIHGFRDLISFRAENWALERYQSVCSISYRTEVKRDVTQGLFQIIGASMEVISYLLVLIVGGRLVVINELGIGDLVSFLGTIELIFFPVRYANDLFGTVLQSYAAAKRIWEFLDREKMRRQLPQFNGIKLKSVNFKYLGSNKQVLTDITCSIEKGKLVAVVGKSGSGKSTLLQLMAGLYSNTGGEVEYLGDDRVSTAYVWQDPFLFNDLLYDNLTFGKAIPMDEIKKVASSVNADTIIANLKEQLLSHVQRNGSNFSGGERRRLALTRALLSRPGCLILDEPTAGLDDENAKMVWDVIESLGSRVTRIISTHRLEEAKKADFILVLQNGKLIESGSHHELMVKEGYYASMFY